MLTPDQRLRVFVSSTLQELGPERAAARAAIEGLGLTPVWFEHGARPHPPETLYRAYLEQSQVFVGIYWQSYGWLAPGAELSGIENEYRLAGGLPRLLYLKEPAPEREPRLAALLASFDDDAATYTTFGTPEELRSLVAADLALLLSERFDAGERAVRARPGTVPTPTTSFVDRVAELERVERLLVGERARLVTLSGPGGIGKTRLAVEAARRVGAGFADGVVFVPLDGIGEAELVWPAVAAAAGMRDVSSDALGALASHLRGRELLLLLDNFEHVIDAAPGLGSLLEQAPRVAALVTSRELLRLRAEHEVAVPPLAPEEEAVVLFSERAAAASHAFRLAPDDLPIVAEICRRLDGVPLAIELAAPRLRLLTPTQLLERLRERLALASPRDAPARQQTLDAAIGWSYELLGPEERLLFEQLGAFRGSFVLEAVEAVCELPPGVDLLELLSSLLDKSIVYRVSPEGTRFAMLGMIRDFARERLRLSGELDATLERLSGVYLRAAPDAEIGLSSVEQRRWKRFLDAEADNVRSVLSWLDEQGRGAEMATLVRGIWIWYWLRAQLDECREWCRRTLAHDDVPDRDRGWVAAIDGMESVLQGHFATGYEGLVEGRALLAAAGDERGVAMADMMNTIVTAMSAGEEAAQAQLATALATMERLGDASGVAMCLNVNTWLRQIFRHFDGAGDLFERALAACEALGDELEIAMALGNLAEARLARGDVAAAREAVTRALRLLQESGSTYTVPDQLETLAACEAAGGAPERAAEIFGASETLREKIGVPLWGPAVDRHEELRERLRAALGEAEFAAATARGRARPREELVPAAADAAPAAAP